MGRITTTGDEGGLLSWESSEQVNSAKQYSYASFGRGSMRSLILSWNEKYFTLSDADLTVNQLSNTIIPIHWKLGKKNGQRDRCDLDSRRGGDLFASAFADGVQAAASKEDARCQSW